MFKTHYKQQNKILLSLLTMLFFIPIINIISAVGPSDPECYELGNCQFFQAPLDAMLAPFLGVFGAFFYIIVWGFIIGILWLRVSNTMLVGIIGIILAVLFQPQFGDDETLIGYLLLGLAVAVALYQILVVRSHYPTN